MHLVENGYGVDVVFWIPGFYMHGFGKSLAGLSPTVAGNETTAHFGTSEAIHRVTVTNLHGMALSQFFFVAFIDSSVVWSEVNPGKGLNNTLRVETVTRLALSPIWSSCAVITLWNKTVYFTQKGWR
jgi:hypothetical protein